MSVVSTNKQLEVTETKTPPLLTFIKILSLQPDVLFPV